MIYSPLRYPGGKKRLSKFIAKICVVNDIDGHYIEPYAGGASVALFLLFEGIISNITINDKDRAIYAFWYSVLNHTNELCELIEKTEVNVKTWKTQRLIQNDKDNDDLLKLGFSTLFMNRTNISGIIKGGIIGGLNQSGMYKIDCRFNKSNIISRIREISNKKESISLFNLDAMDLLSMIEKESKSFDTIFYFDPPYYFKGRSLYMHHYKHEDHKQINSLIKQIKKHHWIVSYDNVEEIRNLYQEFHKKEYSLKHTAHSAKEGSEVLFFSNNLILPNGNWTPFDFKNSYRRNDREAERVTS